MKTHPLLAAIQGSEIYRDRRDRARPPLRIGLQKRRANSSHWSINGVLRTIVVR